MFRFIWNFIFPKRKPSRIDDPIVDTRNTLYSWECKSAAEDGQDEACPSSEEEAETQEDIEDKPCTLPDTDENRHLPSGPRGKVLDDDTVIFYTTGDQVFLTLSPETASEIRSYSGSFVELNYIHDHEIIEIIPSIPSAENSLKITDSKLQPRISVKRFFNQNEIVVASTTRASIVRCGDKWNVMMRDTYIPENEKMVSPSVVAASLRDDLPQEHDERLKEIARCVLALDPKFRNSSIAELVDISPSEIRNIRADMIDSSLIPDEKERYKKSRKKAHSTNPKNTTKKSHGKKKEPTIKVRQADVIRSMLIDNPHMSNRSIAHDLGINDCKQVRNIRKRLEEDGIIDKVDYAIGRNGRKIKK